MGMKIWQKKYLNYTELRERKTDTLLMDIIIKDSIKYARDKICETESIIVQQYTDEFNAPIYEFNICNTVRALIFGERFNQSVDYLPSHIELIIYPLNSNFSKSVDNLPVGCKYLLLGENFEKSLNLLPASIKFVEYALFSECYRYIYETNNIT